MAKRKKDLHNSNLFGAISLPSEPYRSAINSRKASSRTVRAIRQPNLFNPAHFFALSVATVGETQSFEPLVQEFLKDDQQEFIFPTKKKKKMVVEKNSY